jgi:MFS family permease
MVRAAHPEPLLDLRVAARRPVLLTNIASVAMGFSLFSSNVSYPQLLELPAPTGFGLTLLAASLVIMPSGLVMMVLSPFSGRLASTVGPRRLLILGAIALIAAYGFSLLFASAVWHILIANLLIGVGIGFGYAAMPMLIMRSVPQSETGASNGLNALFRSLGTSSAAAVVGAVLASMSSVQDGRTSHGSRLPGVVLAGTGRCGDRPHGRRLHPAAPRRRAPPRAAAGPLTSHHDRRPVRQPRTRGPSGDRDARFFGQPWALAHVFGVEMWERFSFYGMQGILLIYLYYSVSDGGLGVEEVAAGIVGAYGGAVYLSTILGAWIADRLLGAERVLFGSAIVIMAGHRAGGAARIRRRRRRARARRDRLGRLKATATSVVGTLYGPDDAARRRLLAVLPRHQPRRLRRTAADRCAAVDAGLPLGLRAGRRRHGAGLVQYSFGRRQLAGGARGAEPLPRERYPLMAGIAAAGIVLIVVLVLVGVIRADNLAIIVIVVVIAAALAYFAVILSSRRWMPRSAAACGASCRCS